MAYVNARQHTEDDRDFADALMDRGVGVKQFNLTGADIGELVIDLVDAVMVIGCRRFWSAAPPALYCAGLVNVLRPKNQASGNYRSFGWGSKMVDQSSGCSARSRPSGSSHVGQGAAQ